MLQSKLLARTVILGNSGSGKSWLAEQLAQLLKSQAFDLDEIHWLPGSYQTRRDLSEARTAVRAVAAGDRWIIEGVYGSLVAEALPRATALVMLDVSDDECVSNIQTRGLRRGGDVESHQKLIAWVQEYRTRESPSSLSGHGALFEAFHGPKIRLRSREEIASQVRALHTSASEI
jgi:adenylate kinase family enzyme